MVEEGRTKFGRQNNLASSSLSSQCMTSCQVQLTFSFGEKLKHHYVLYAKEEGHWSAFLAATREQWLKVATVNAMTKYLRQLLKLDSTISQARGL